MDANFWLARWAENDIGFHQSRPHPLLIKYSKDLSLREGSRVFLPLCGKTSDIPWLLSKGYQVAGAELAPMAVDQLFADLKMKAHISDAGQTRRYSAKDIDIFVGDIFNLSDKLLGRVDAVYDRAALVALPKEMRDRYAAHLKNISNHASQLLICYEYDQKLMEGPPFSVSGEEIRRHYQDSYEITLVESVEVAGGLRGKASGKETVWLLKKMT
jgi:thiopurine S-methyltransferase